MLSPTDWHAIQLSLIVSATAVLLYAGPCVLLGVWLARRRGTSRTLAQVVLMSPLVMPPVVTGLLLLRFFTAINLPIYFTWVGAAVASGLVAMPLWIRTVRAAVDEIDPRLFVAGATLGARKYRRHLTITLPLTQRAIIGGAVLFWARALGEFGAVMVVAGNTPGKTQTIPLAIYSKINSLDPGAIWPLVGVSLGLSVLTICISEILSKPTKL